MIGIVNDGLPGLGLVHGGYTLNIFFDVLCKILMANGLLVLGRGQSGQNIESQ